MWYKHQYDVSWIQALGIFSFLRGLFYDANKIKLSVCLTLKHYAMKAYNSRNQAREWNPPISIRRVPNSIQKIKFTLYKESLGGEDIMRFWRQGHCGRL